MSQTYFNCHNHTMYSNLRLLDCINRPKALVDKAIELGLAGIAITDHEALSAHMIVNQYAKKLRETNPDFKIILGNEIYLVDERENGQRYWHFILMAKNEVGHKALRELSSTAWLNSYFDRGMERVPITKEELAAVVKKYPDSLMATSACLGGELSGNLLLYTEAAAVNDIENAKRYYQKAKSFLDYCVNLFGEDFYIECAPAGYKEQIAVNKELYNMAKNSGCKLTVGTDSHYLRPEDRYVHKAYLNSKGGEREVDSFYEFTYLMSPKEVRDLLSLSFGDDNYIIDWIFQNSLDIMNKAEWYSLERKQVIPRVALEERDYIIPIAIKNLKDELPTLYNLFISDENQERVWVNDCYDALLNIDIPEASLETYLKRLEVEAKVIKVIGDGLEDCLFSYFNTFKHYINLFWECGSIVGPGRGSATGFLSNYLLGITQLDPIRWELEYWRFLNEERVELPDIDIDLAPSKRPYIFKKIREERGELGLVQVATFGSEGTKSAVLTSARGYRSEDFPDGIDVDQAQYMSSLIPSERGFLWPIKDVVYGNPEKGRKPVSDFVREVNNYPGLLDIIISIEGLINKRSTHASGVILYDEDPYEMAAFMRTPGGDIITCYDLHDLESAGSTKYDFLVTEISDKIIVCLELLKKDGLVENNFSLRDLYNKYLHPESLDTSRQDIWDRLEAGDVLDVFQFSTGVGLAVAKKLAPQNPFEMTAANAMMRLMSEKGVESQQDRYERIKRQGIEVFEVEMREHKIPEDMKKIFHKHCDRYYGCCALQEQMMMMLMEAANFSLAESNAARKIVAKKQMDKIPELKKKVFDSFEDHGVGEYFWKLAVEPQLG